MQIALASCQTLPEPDPDEAPLLAALRARGVQAATLAWDDPESDFGAAALTLLRATWNYPEQPERFLAWIASVSAHSALWNPAAVVRWNHHKRYLLDLAAHGVPIVPTELVARGAAESLAAICARRGFGEVVIKPAIGAGSASTRRFDAAERGAGEAHLRTLAARGDVLVQPYLSAVQGRGERSLIWIDGEVTHAVRKAARFAGDAERVDPASDVSAEERALAHAALTAVSPTPFYARVDLIEDERGAPRVMELELIEPSLYFAHGPRGLERFVEGALARLRSSSKPE